MHFCSDGWLYGGFQRSLVGFAGFLAQGSLLARKLPYGSHFSVSRTHDAKWGIEGRHVWPQQLLAAPGVCDGLQAYCCCSAAVAATWMQLVKTLQRICIEHRLSSVTPGHGGSSGGHVHVQG